MLKRSNTRFGLTPSRGLTVDAGENESNETNPTLAASDNDSSELKQRASATRDQEAPPKIRPLFEGKDRGEVRQPLDKSMPPAFPSKVAAVGTVRIRHSSPWESLKKRFSLSLEDSVTIASRKDGIFVAVRKFSGPNADREVRTLQRIREENLPNFLAFLECFSFEGSLYAVFEHELSRNEKLLTLSHYALIKRYPTEPQLAFILGQILDGLKHLASIGLEHGAVKCKNILISTDGCIRIASQERCREIGSRRGSIRDIKGIGYVTMELMHKDAKYDGPIKVRDVSRWPLDSTAVDFLLMTASAYSIEELAKHTLFTCNKTGSDIDELRADIRANVYKSEFSVFRGNDEE